jgi:RHS repeat-associated protein
MGVPIRYSDASGNMVNPTGDYSVPGFPGQSQTTTDLYYNKYRDYDPTTGRYIQADPIGLAGGASPYSYAMNNPLRYSDPQGLCIWDGCIVEGMVVGALIGGLIDLDWQLAVQHRDPGCIDWASVAWSGSIGSVTGGIGEAVGPLLGRLGARIAPRLFRPAAERVPGLAYTRGQLQHGFKHAGDFGILGNASNKTMAEFSSAIQNHLAAPGTQAIQGTYRGQAVTHFLDPSTGLNVIRDSSGNFLSGWKLSPKQLEYVTTTGKLGGGR